jgi:hypothetical protein
MALAVRVLRMLTRRLGMFRRLLGVGFSHLMIALAVMLSRLTMALGGTLVMLSSLRVFFFGHMPLPFARRNAASD